MERITNVEETMDALENEEGRAITTSHNLNSMPENKNLAAAYWSEL